MHRFISFPMLLVCAGCCCCCPPKSPKSPSAPAGPGDPTPPVVTIDEWAGHLVFSPSGDRLAGGEGGANSAIKVWDSTTGERLLHFVAHKQTVTGLAFTHDGKQLISASQDGDIKIWDAATGELLRTIDTGLSSGASSLALSPQGDQIACGGGTYYTRREGMNPGGHSCPIKVWDFATGEELMELTSHNTTGGIKSLAFSPEGDQLVSGSTGGPKITVWSLPTGELLRTLTWHDQTNGINCLTYSPEGDQIACGSKQTVKIWSADTGEELRTLGKKGEMGRVGRVEFSPDGQLIATATGFGVLVWDASSGKQVRTLKDLNRDKTIRLGGVREIGTSQDIASAAIFSPDGKRIACVFRKILLWDIE